MIKISVGDYILTEDKYVYRVISSSVTDTETYYNIKSITKFIDIAVLGNNKVEYFKEPHEIRALRAVDIYNFGTIIKEKDSKILKVLYR